MNQEHAKKVFADWAVILRPFIETKNFDELSNKIVAEPDSCIYPNPRSLIFRAFRETSLASLRVIILAEEPYSLFGYADGLAFSTGMKDYEKLSSLKQLLKGMEDDYLNGVDLIRDIRSGDLSYLCKQGVALINTSLTIQGKNELGTGEIVRHTDLWAPFIRFVIDQVQQYKNNVIIVAMGPTALKACSQLDVFRNNCFFLYVEHPLEGARKEKEGIGCWEHKNMFTRINEIIRINQLGEPIDWLPNFNS